MAIKVDVPLDAEFLRYTELIFDKDGSLAPLGSDTPEELAKKVLEKYENLKKTVKDRFIGEQIGSFYKTLRMLGEEKAINVFQNYLKRKTGQEYQIRLITDGNI